jgi:hypothetical protein
MASVYWYFTGHAVPALIGIVILFMYTEKLAFGALLIAGAAISSIIYYFFSDFFAYESGDDVLQYGTGIMYMLVIWLKARRIFNNDEFGLD